MRSTGRPLRQHADHEGGFTHGEHMLVDELAAAGDGLVQIQLGVPRVDLPCALAAKTQVHLCETEAGPPMKRALARRTSMRALPTLRWNGTSELRWEATLLQVHHDRRLCVVMWQMATCKPDAPAVSGASQATVPLTLA